MPRAPSGAGERKLTWRPIYAKATKIWEAYKALLCMMIEQIKYLLSPTDIKIEATRKETIAGDEAHSMQCS